MRAENLEEITTNTKLVGKYFQKYLVVWNIFSTFVS